MNENGWGVSIKKKKSQYVKQCTEHYLLVTLTTMDKKRHLETLRGKI